MVSAEPMRVLVLGARGAVGRAVVETLRDWHHEVTPAGRRGVPDGVCIDLGDARGLDALATVCGGYDAVVNASGVEDPRIARCVGSAALVDVSATSPYLRALAAATPPTTSVVLGVGLAPGLSTLLAAELDTRVGDDVDVAILLGSGERHGAAAVEWTSRLPGSLIDQPPESTTVHNLRERRRFVGPDGHARTYLRADFPDHHLLDAARGLAVRDYLALSSPAATWALAAVGRAPALRPILTHAPHLGSDRWSITAVNRRTGQRLHARGHGQSLATGRLAALTTAAVIARPPGRVVTTPEMLRLADTEAVLGTDTVADHGPAVRTT